MRVRDLIVRRPVTVDADSTIHEIAEKMKREEVGMIPVLSNGHAVGVVADRDLVIRVLAPIMEPHIMTAWDVMTRDPIMVDEEATFDKPIELMHDNRVRRLIVNSHDGTPIGVVSLSDLCRQSNRAVELLQSFAMKVDQPARRAIMMP